MVVIVLASAVLGRLDRETRPAPLLPDPLSFPSSSGAQRCRCGCVGLRVREAHLTQLVSYWRTQAETVW